MKKNPSVQNAIDESLDSVRFSARDMHAVMRAVRADNRESAPCRAPARRKHSPLRFALCAAALVIAILPLSRLIIGGLGRLPEIKTITPLSQTAGGDPILDDTQLDVAAPPADDGIFDERDAVSIARACFEAQCDTSVFSFEEYTIETESEEADGRVTAYTVRMRSIYDNGCSFRVTVSAPDGEVLSFSTPRLATVPMYLNTQSPEVLGWYERYGRHIFTWPLDVQAEFSRRYEGGALRMPREGEADPQTIAKRFGSHIHISELTDDPNEHQFTYYTMLYSERASADGVARYQVYCFAGGEIADTLPPVYALLTFRAADGAFESKQILETSGQSM